MNPSQWQFPPESLIDIPSSNFLPITALPTAQRFIAPLYQNPLYHPIAAPQSTLTGSEPTSTPRNPETPRNPVQTAPTHSASLLEIYPPKVR